MAALISLRLQSLSVIDVASGEPDLPCSPSRSKYFHPTSVDNGVVVDDHDRSVIEYPIRVFIDESITAEEAAVHDEVERILRNRKVAAVVLQRWWREESARRRFASCLKRKLLSHFVRLWRRQLLGHQLAPMARLIVLKAVESAEIRSHSAMNIFSLWRGIRIRRYCQRITEHGRNLLQRKTSAQLISLCLHRYVIQREAALKIQTFWRTYCRIRSRRISAAITIQRAYRRFAAKYQQAMILCLRTVFIAYLTRMRFVSLRSVVLISQAYLLAIVAYHQYAGNIQHIRILQHRFRRKRLRQKFRTIVQNYTIALTRSAVRLQASWRGHVCRRSLGGSVTVLRARAVVIQTEWHRYRSLKEYDRLKQEEMIARIRAGCFAYLAKLRFLSLRVASEISQACFSTVFAFDEHVANIQSVRILQHIFRRNRLRRAFRNVVLLFCQNYKQARDRSAVCLQAIWRGRTCRRFIGGSIRKLCSSIFAIQAELRCYLFCKELLRLKKQSELDNRRQVLISQLESLPDSRDQRLQLLRERFSERLANIECVEEPQETSAALPARASVLSALDAKRSRLFRVKAQLDMIKSVKQSVRSLADASSLSVSDVDQNAKLVRSVKWGDDYGSVLTDSTNHKCTPKVSVLPLKPCIKVSTNANLQRKRAQRIINVLSTTFGKARVCKGNSSTSENSSKNGNITSATTPQARSSAKSPLSSSARRVRVVSKFS